MSLREAAAWAEQTLRQWLPDECGVAALATEPPLPELPLIEAAEVANAVEVRRHEFALGRMAARAAMHSIGLPPAPIARGADRAPVWPSGVVGSIAHHARIAIAAVARSDRIRAIGIDLEGDAAVAEPLWRQVLTPTEVTFVKERGGDAPERWATAIFALKEAFYKFQYPLTRQWLDFQEVDVVLDLNAETATVKTYRPIAMSERWNDALTGRFCIGPSLILTALYREH